MPTVAVTGAELHFGSIGDGPPCLVMHGGLGLDCSYLRPWLDPLVGDLRLVIYDHRANGRSTGDPASITVARLADDAEELREALGLGPVGVIGHSYGGFVALEYALRHPDSLSFLVLCDTAPGPPDREAQRAMMHRLGATAEVLERFGRPAADDADLADWLATMLPMYFPADPAAGRRAFSAMRIAHAPMRASMNALQEWTLEGRADAIRTPTLVVAGAEDFILPVQHSHRLHELIPGSRLHVMDGVGHLPFVERPGEFCSIVSSFAASVLRG